MLNDLLRFVGVNFSSAPNPAASQDAGGASGGAPASGSGAPSQPPAQQGGGAGQGIEQLRTAYEGIKAKFEPFEKLNLTPDQITSYSGVYQKTFGEIAAIGRQLGYPDDQIIEALQENPVATLDFLRNELAAARQGQQQDRGDRDLQEMIESRVSEAVGPVQEWQNTQMTSQANALFERTVYQSAADMYRQEGVDIAQVPPEEVELLLSATSEILKYDEDALRALKYEGKTASIQKAFIEAKTMLDKYFIARSQRSSAARPPGSQAGRGPNGQFLPGGQQGGGKRPTLNEMIDDPGLINQRYREAQ